MDIYSIHYREDAHLSQLISKNTWGACLFSSPFYIHHILSCGSPQPSQEVKTPQSPFSFFRQEFHKIKYILPFPLTHIHEYYFLLPGKNPPSFKQALFHAGIHPHLAVPPPRCANIPGTAKQWNGCTTDGTSGTLHVPKSGRQKYLIKNSILCFGSISVMDFQGLGCF